jgi:hypothetical protein
MPIAWGQYGDDQLSVLIDSIDAFDQEMLQLLWIVSKSSMEYFCR